MEKLNNVLLSQDPKGSYMMKSYFFQEKDKFWLKLRDLRTANKSLFANNYKIALKTAGSKKYFLNFDFECKMQKKVEEYLEIPSGLLC